MTLLRRLMWPKMGEEIAVYKDGALIAEGEVTYMDERSVSILGPRSDIFKLDCSELLRGIENRSIVVKKKKIVQ